MKMKKKQFRIGQLAQKIGTERFVIRFWEKEFGLHSSRSSGGQRFYDEADLAIFSRIKQLLYEQGFTINGAKKQLSQENNSFRGAHKSDLPSKQEQIAQKDNWDTDELVCQIGTLKKQLKKLRNLL